MGLGMMVESCDHASPLPCVPVSAAAYFAPPVPMALQVVYGFGHELRSNKEENNEVHFIFDI